MLLLDVMNPFHFGGFVMKEGHIMGKSSVPLPDPVGERDRCWFRVDDRLEDRDRERGRDERIVLLGGY